MTNYQFALICHQLNRMGDWKQASEVADLIIAQPLDSGMLLYNKFKNLLSYYSVTTPFLSMKRALETTTLATDYELEGTIYTIHIYK
jgi:F0F1-type ATP synthase gamma subunit